MRRLYSDDSLEDFLKQNSDRFQMRPSDKVWKGISDRLKRRNRRIGWLTGFFVVAASLSGYLISELQGNDPKGMAYQQAGSKNSDGANGNQSTGTASTSPLASTDDLNGSTSDVNSTDAASGSAPVRQMFSGKGPKGTTALATGGAAATGRNTRLRSFRSGRRGQYHATNPLTTDYLASESSNSSQAEIDRMYTDASLAEPALARLSGYEPGNPNGKPQPLKMLPADRLSVQFFVTPTLSYRSLTENKEFTNDVPQTNATPNTYALYNINDAVSHKPSLGLEMGVSAKYALARNIKVQGGVQFNMSRYVVQAFDNYAPQTATIAYNGGGSSTSRTSYSNLNGGGRRENLQNLYFQVSAPIGLELKIAGNSRTNFGVTSTIQPTYILSDRVYMLSTDYKSYAEIPWLIRRWNVNTALSTYVGYSTGKLAWQVGPQVRYQLMSSFVSKYPVKENLFDFGLRVGVALNKGSH